MKKLVMGLLLTTVLMLILASLVTCGMKKNNEKTLEQKLIAMSPKDRAEMLLSLSEQRLTGAESYTLSITSTVTLTTTERSASSVSHLTRYVAGIGTADYAARSQERKRPSALPRAIGTEASTFPRTGATAVSVFAPRFLLPIISPLRGRILHRQ